MLIDDLGRLPDSFKCGWRGLLLLYRSKDGQSGNAQRKAVKMITNGVEEWTEGVNRLRAMRDYGLTYSNHRIYASVNERNIQKAIYEFKRRQLEADYGNSIELEKFYQDIDNRFFSCLMNPSCRATSCFLIDCDSKEDYQRAIKQIPQDMTLLDYETKNGRHLITRPFNPVDVDFDVKKDDLLFLG